MPKMIVSIDGVVIKEVTIVKDRTTLGRRPYNDIVIDNLAISGEHAVLHMIDGGVYLEDLNSTNGTYVNTRAVRRHLLEHNDVIEVGKYKIRYLAVNPAVAAPAGAVAASSPPIAVAAPSRPAPTASAPGVMSPLGGGVAPAAIRVSCRWPRSSPPSAARASPWRPSRAACTATWSLPSTVAPCSTASNWARTPSRCRMAMCWNSAAPGCNSSACKRLLPSRGWSDHGCRQSPRMPKKSFTRFRPSV
jgi:predicted component of type VI protein secretion system